MKILLTGGGTGGHFYPLIAVAEEINKIIDDEKIADMFSCIIFLMHPMIARHYLKIEFIIQKFQQENAYLFFNQEFY
jgi:UDP-N-acetylglucosamine:LPS N-acetylglucosamine transferase